MGDINRHDYLWSRGWKLYSGAPGSAHSMWVRKDGRIYIRRVAYSIQRQLDKRDMEAKFK